uniref:Uncharacterized protein n=1 Tax=Globodera rostochiensis TaxID=31243 RepID=A0A914H7T0_GLORO
MMPGEETVYKSIDRAEDETRQRADEYLDEYLNALNPSGYLKCAPPSDQTNKRHVLERMGRNVCRMPIQTKLTYEYSYGISDDDYGDDEVDAIIDDSADGNEVKNECVNFKGNVLCDGAKEMVVEIFCRQTDDKIDFFTDAEGNFKIVMSMNLKASFYKCTTGLIIGFYKNQPTKTRLRLTNLLKSPKKKAEQKKRLLKCFVSVRFKRLKFGTKQFVDEATNQAPQIDDVSEEEEAKNEFCVEFGTGGKATINGQTYTCSDSHVDRNFDLYSKYFDGTNEEDQSSEDSKRQNEEQSSSSTSGTHN